MKNFASIFQIYVILLLLSFHAATGSERQTTSHNKNSHRKYIRYVGNEDGIRYNQITPFQWEWSNDFNSTEFSKTLAPVHFWMKCVDRRLKVFFFIINPIRSYHDGNIGTSITSIFKDKKIKIFIYFNESYSRNINYFVQGVGGGNFEISLNEFSSDSIVNIHISDWSQFARFHVSDCLPPKRQQSLKYVVTAFTKFFYPEPVTNYNMKYIEGVANQLKYHRCALPLHRYEIIIQKNLVEHFLKNSYIAEAASNGLVNFIIQESFIPIYYHLPKATYPNTKDNYFLQHIELNVAVLRHWSQSIRMFMLDPDEYLIFHRSFTLNQLNNYVNKYSTIFIKRSMTVCLSCLQNNKKEPEINTFSFTDNNYVNWQYTTLDKLLVNPNTCGNLVVHWMEGGSQPTHYMDRNILFISHFEQLFRHRWKDIKISDLIKKPSITKNTSFPVLKYCDPAYIKSYGDAPKQYFVSQKKVHKNIKKTNSSSNNSGRSNNKSKGVFIKI